MSRQLTFRSPRTEYQQESMYRLSKLMDGVACIVLLRGNSDPDPLAIDVCAVVSGHTVYVVCCVERRACTDETMCGEVTPQPGTTSAGKPASSCRLLQVNVPGCISYETFYKALEFTYCGEVDPTSPVPDSPNSSRKVRL